MDPQNDITNIVLEVSAEQDGRTIASAVRAFWLKLIEEAPFPMPEDFCKELTAMYLENVVSGGCRHGGEDE